MGKAITYSFGDNFIKKCAHFLCDNFLKKGNDLSHIACIFGGRRPAMFLRREISRIIKKSYIPPRIFSIDEFIDYIGSGTNHLGCELEIEMGNKNDDSDIPEGIKRAKEHEIKVFDDNDADVELRNKIFDLQKHNFWHKK